MAEQIIKDFKPDAVLGTGGYVSFPVLRAALKRNIPTFIHESNSAPGLVTRIIAKRCAMVFLGTKTTNKKLNELKNVILTGTPVRGAFGTIGRQNARRKLGLTEKDIYIVSFGGSIGAEKFNDVIVEFMKRFSSKDVRIKHTHGSGERFFENINNNHPELCKGFSGCKIVPYINDMPTVLSAADIAITRAGAATLSELSLCATASILVPSPNVSEDHQKRNAEIYQNRGAAIMLEENSLTYDTLIEKIKILLKDKHKRLTLSKSIHELATPNASINILNEICKWIHKSNSAPI
jgi:UDP-N-acetylglucosamine--N-acetylmuramyl-(pentapeptide) pyrophosphoryl-undecaprenol N-acetylglucosamine transferase